MKDLVLISLDAHRDYVVSKIESKVGRLYYQEMMETIRHFVLAVDNYYLPVFVLEHSFAQLRESPLSLNRELKYKRLALEHATEVMVSINKRFYVKN